jgi:Tol biopolymer transport system component
MNIPFCKWFQRTMIACVATVVVSLNANPLQLLSVRDGTSPASAGGNEESGSAIISADGRYVLFASLAANLTIISNPVPQSGLLPQRQQVFLRDRFTGQTKLVSLNSAGNYGGNGDSFPAGISTNSQFFLFESTATNLVSSDANNYKDIFLRDLVNGTNLLISVRIGGGSGNGTSRSASMTPDGRYIAFISAANNLVSNDTNGIPDVFVRDRVAGTTTLISVGSRMTSLPAFATGSSETPEITPDGRYVVFYSSATNIIPGVTNVGEVYVRDRIAGTTMMASTNARALLQATVGTSNGISCNHRISADGRYVAFVTATNPIAGAYSRGVAMRHDLQTGETGIIHINASVPNLPPEDIRTLDLTLDGRFVAFVANTNIDGSPAQAVYRWDAQTGIAELVSQNLDGSVAAGTSCDWPTLDASGRYVAFVCTGANLVTNTLVGTPQLYIRDLQTGSTELLSQNASGVGYGANTVTAPAVSADGQVVVFDAWDGELTTEDNNEVADVFARNRTQETTELISTRHPALPARTVRGNNSTGIYDFSLDGRYVAFTSDGTAASTGASNGFRNAFLRDLFLGTNYLVSVATNGLSGNGNTALLLSISGEGRYVALASYANNLIANDTNNFADVFVWDRQTRTCQLVSVKTNSNASGESRLPIISSDGRYVTFRSFAQNLTTTATTAFTENLFQRDLQTGVTRALTTAGAGNWAQTTDGSRVAFVGRIPGDASDKIYIWNSSAAARIYTNTISFPLQVGISANGQRLAFLAGTSSSASLYGVNLALNTSSLVSPGVLIAPWGLKLSADGRYLAYSTTSPKFNDSNGTNDVWLYDFQTSTNIQVCRRYDSALTPNGPSDHPDISPDGRFVVYRSRATNAVTNDQNNMADILLFDRLSNATYPVTRARTGNSMGNNFSTTPAFSGDGRMLLFSSWASDLQAGDYNNGSDVIGLALPTTALTDADGDGLDDTWETLNFGSLNRNDSADFDGDGASDRLEFQTATNPTNQNSAFRAELSLQPNPVVQWPALPWRTYQIEFQDTLATGAWQTLSNAPVLSNGFGELVDSNPNPDRRFYRVLLTP